MKEINGTITLAFVEEDNKQRVIFRVIPLCTREGVVFHGGADDFPDEGSLRIVPDKREQSTFKERMREIGGLCAICLLSEGKELMKVRQNRNYAPDQGERNQLAIYSDVICEFAEDSCFEVVDVGLDASSALTAKVLLHKDKMLYGPVARAEAKDAAIDTLKPFGNDRFLLHTIEAAELGKHLIYWDPENTLNWRQRRGTLRRRDRNTTDEATQTTKPAVAQEASAPKVEQADAKPAEQDAPALKMEPHLRRVERSAEILREQSEPPKAEVQTAEQSEAEPPKAEMPAAEPAKAEPQQEKAEAETALPIGTRLDILDSELPFEQQISRLAQPLSEQANRLSDIAELDEPEAEEEPETQVRFSGTPLVKTASTFARSASRPDPVYHVVEQQMRKKRGITDGGTYDLMDNPIEDLQECVDYVWQNADMREQGLSVLMENERFVNDMLTAFRAKGLNLHATAAAQEQMAEIEAERLSLLMQLEMAKENERKYRDEAVAAAIQKKREELERLKRDTKELEDKKAQLELAAQTLSNSTAQQVTDFLAEHMTCLSGAGQERLLLTPVMGHDYVAHELVEQLRVHMNESGFSVSEDEAMNLLIGFSLYDAICFRGRTIADAQLFAKVLLESFGLQSVSAIVRPGSYVEMMSLLPEDARRTPTVTVQPLGTETMTVFGHKTLFLTAEEDMPTDAVLPYPVVNVPAMLKRAFGTTVQWKAVEAASLSSFSGLGADTHPLLDEAEKWFAELKQQLTTELNVPDTLLVSMRRFIEVASRKVRGGFLAAADTAVCHWVVPLLLMRKCDTQKLGSVLSGLPHTMDMLNIR